MQIILLFCSCTVYHFLLMVQEDITYTLNRKTLTSFVRTKPRGSVVITKPLAVQMSLCACKAIWFYYMDLYH